MKQNKKNFSVTVKIWAVLVLFAVASVFSVLLMGKVGINYNLADYLGKGTETKSALDIIDKEFGSTGSLQVMISDISADTADSVCEKIEDIPNVLNVSFDRYSEKYYRDGKALYVVLIDGDDYSDNAKQVSDDIKTALADFENVEYGGTTTEKFKLRESITSEMVSILAISLSLVAVILLITSESWLEPLVLLASSGIAVLLNRGSNLVFGEISYITNSVSAILQLALSIDYSIVLLHAYRTEKESAVDNATAMNRAILKVLKPVSASALTTIAGLLALLFMSFRIGFDIGIVLMKGIVISAFTSVTLLPALVLLLDRPMKRLHKKAFAPKGKLFCRLACRAGAIVLPIALVLVGFCGILQTGNTYIFTDTGNGNSTISDAFGSNNSVAVVYRNTENNFANEEKLIENLNAYKTADGETVLRDYTAYTNTVREYYDLEKAVQKLDLDENDVEMLLTMYRLYKSPDDVKMTFSDFVTFACDLTQNDEDAKELVADDTAKTLKTLKAVCEIADGTYTAEGLHEKLTSGVFDDIDITLFDIRQLYGLYFYDTVTEKAVDYRTMLAYIISVGENADGDITFDEDTLNNLKTLYAGIQSFDEKMATPMDKTTFKGWFYQNMGVLLSDEQLTQIYAGYFASTGEETSDTIPFLPLMNFLVQNGTLTDETAVATVTGYNACKALLDGQYGYEQFLTVTGQVATALTGANVEMTATDEEIQQIYILYFYENGRLTDHAIVGREFVTFALDTDKTNAVIHEKLSDGNRTKLSDILTVDKYNGDTALRTFDGLFDTLNALQNTIGSDIAKTDLNRDDISGVYIKYAIKVEKLGTPSVMACDLLDFVTENMDVNSLLVRKMTDENRQKVTDAQDDVDRAEDLFVGENYSRLILSVDLPNESENTTDFVAYLSDEVKNVFGEDAYIAGEIVSTYDLQETFDYDNKLITIFTLVSIFVIVMLIFRSLSLPVILVAVIEGAILVAMSTQLLTAGVFFMSYIVATCILMGATIDYGILLSSNYVADRTVCDKKESLRRAVETAMPTVFTSGMILIVCGFVIHFVSGQNSISTVGLLLGIGTICSVVMITVVLPSVLYLCDRFVLTLSVRKKK